MSLAPQGTSIMAGRAEDESRLRAEGVRMVHDLAFKLLDEIIAEHRSARPTIFGGPSKQHHRLIGGSRALKELGIRITKLHGDLTVQADAP